MRSIASVSCAQTQAAGALLFFFSVVGYFIIITHLCFCISVFFSCQLVFWKPVIMLKSQNDGSRKYGELFLVIAAVAALALLLASHQKSTTGMDTKLN